MTDKDIIIDGIDVSECKYQSPNPHFFSNERFCNLFGKCKGRDCYYKQLQKEKFENLNNRQMVESAENLIYENSELYKNLKEKEQECEELKAQIETYSKILKTPEFKVALTDVRTGEREVWRKLGSKAQRYNQALDEIEKNIRHCIKQDICTLCVYSDKCRNEFDYNSYDNNIFILDIISKAKENNQNEQK